MGAPRGNKNAAGSDQTAPKPFLDAITRACKQEDGKRLRAAAEQLLNLAAAGEPWAIKELADRVDGKAKQQTEISGDPERPLTVEMGLSQAARDWLVRMTVSVESGD